MEPINTASPLPDIKKLSPRQMEITRLLVEGKNARQIAHILSISPETVKTHINIACRKMDAGNRVQLIVMFVRWQTIKELSNDFNSL